MSKITFLNICVFLQLSTLVLGTNVIDLNIDENIKEVILTNLDSTPVRQEQFFPLLDVNNHEIESKEKFMRYINPKDEFNDWEEIEIQAFQGEITIFNAAQVEKSIKISRDFNLKKNKGKEPTKQHYQTHSQHIN